jgi:type I restriction enzyme S subunit
LPEYLFYYFWSEYWNIRRIEKGSNQPGLNTSIIKKFRIPLSPNPEQRRIVLRIEELFTKLDAGIEALTKAKHQLKRYRQSVLTAAFGGKLTEKWREQNKAESGVELLERVLQARQRRGKFKRIVSKIGPPSSLPKTWAFSNIGSIAFVTKLAGFEYTKYVGKLQDEGEVPVIRAQNVQMGQFIRHNIKFISRQTSDFLVRSQVNGSELLMVFIGAGTGNVCLAPCDGRWHLAPNVAKIDVVGGINRKYLLYYLQSQMGIGYMSSWIKSTAQPSLSMETIRQITVPLPPIGEQSRIIETLEYLLSCEDHVAETLLHSLDKANLTRLAILNLAFSGRLVPQNPNDEPAMSLLRETPEMNDNKLAKTRNDAGRIQARLD